MTLAAITFSSLADWQTHFSAPTGGTNRGYWQHDSGRSTSSGSTGPGTNNSNTFQFAHTETSGLQAGDDQLAMDNGVAEFVTVPAGTDRSVRLRVCLQGVFDDGEEGFSIESRPTGGTWTRQELIYGWAYSNARVDGGTFVDYDGETQDVVVDGGWIDRDIAIPDGHTEVRIAPTYLLVSLALRHDMALRSFEWFVGGAPPESTGADHAVDAGAASWAFALPEPSVTRTAPGPQDHAVDAGAASWAFALPEPGVTRTAPITQDHAVDAGAVAWQFVLPQPSTTGGTTTVMAGHEGVTVEIGGTDVSAYVQTRSVRIERRLASPGRAQVVLRGSPSDLTVPSLDDAVTITDKEESRVIYGGTVRTVEPVLIGTGDVLLDIRVGCVSHDIRLAERLIPPDDGIAIAKLDNLKAQIERVIEVLSGDGFTHNVTLATDLDPITSDVRLVTIRAMLEDALDRQDAVISASPTKVVSVYQRADAPDSGVTLDFGEVERLSRRTESRRIRSKQYVVIGQIARTIAFLGDGSAKAFDLTGTEDPTDIAITAAPTSTGANGNPPINGVRWRAQASDTPFGDLSALAAIPGNIVLSKELTFGISSNALTVAQRRRRVTVGTVRSPTEGTQTRREDLSEAWEISPRAIIVEAPGLERLVVPGPAAAGVEISSMAEPYDWVLSAAQDAADVCRRHRPVGAGRACALRHRTRTPSSPSFQRRHHGGGRGQPVRSAQFPA